MRIYISLKHNTNIVKRTGVCYIACLLLSLMTASVLAREYPMPLVLAVHQDNEISSLDKKDVIDIYMGRYSTFPNGQIAKPVDFPTNSIERSTFYQALVGKTERKINAYWSRLLFSGRATPPLEASSKQAVIDLLGESTLIYIHKGDITKEMKIVYQL